MPSRAGFSVGVRAALLACALAAGSGASAADHLRLGTLDFSGCDIGPPHGRGVPTMAALCAQFSVPEDWDSPGGRHITLHLALVRAQGSEAQPDPVVFLDGGPGGAATEDYPAIAAALAPLRKRHSVLLVDQRGTGGSGPLACGDELQLDADATHAPAQQLQRIRRCVAALAPHTAPQFYTTSEAVQDLEAVRQAIGAPSVNLLGISYGTRVAQQYAARYPQAVRSMVLDSAVPNRLVLLSEHAGNLEDALRQRLARCQQEPACKARYGDSYARLREVQERLRHHAQTVELHDPYGFAVVHKSFGPDELVALLRFYLYSATTSALLPYVIDEAWAGRYGPLLAQAQLVVDDVSEHISGGMSASVLCAEDADLLHEQPADSQTLMGAGPVRSALLACQAWPRGRRPANFHEPLQTTIPVLVLAGEFDPVTPPRYGQEIVAGLPNARLLLARGQGHAVIGAGCMPRLVARFVDQRDPAGLDDACLRTLGETAPFLDVNGSAP